ncbi:hypothetical protein [Sedimentibacter sp.]|uniref:hypothetical protein n=1 Tax=Sedimentibacter sp. TaxID=1960295 RepID=UPI0028A8E6FD|nr:hypothetical protein [Sedimentibacter sp.]
MAFIHIRGVIPPMITPFDENDMVDYDKFRRNTLIVDRRILWKILQHLMLSEH